MAGQENTAAAPTVPVRDEVWRDDRGKLTIRYPASHVMIFKYEGHFGETVVPFVEASVNRVLAAGVVPDIYVDLEHMTGYDSAYRIAITKWGNTVRDRCGKWMMLTRSRLVAMGVAVSNMATGGTLEATTKRTEFDVEVAASIRRGPRPKP
jgi:hypothetical protein